MLKSIRISLFLAALGLFSLTACGGAEPTPTEVMPEATIPPLSNDYLGGGVLYDQWTKAIGVDAPEGDHPLWKTQTTKPDRNVLALQRSHGWDYGVSKRLWFRFHMTASLYHG